MRQKDRVNEKDRQEDEQFAESSNALSNTRHIQSNPGLPPAQSSSKGIRALMLPQIVEKRKSLDASGISQGSSLTRTIDYKEFLTSPQLPSRPHSASLALSRDEKPADQPGAPKAHLSAALSKKHSILESQDQRARPSVASSAHQFTPEDPTKLPLAAPPAPRLKPASTQHLSIPSQSQGPSGLVGVPSNSLARGVPRKNQGLTGPQQPQPSISPTPAPVADPSRPSQTVPRKAVPSPSRPSQPHNPAGASALRSRDSPQPLSAVNSNPSPNKPASQTTTTQSRPQQAPLPLISASHPPVARRGSVSCLSSSCTEAPAY